MIITFYTLHSVYEDNPTPVYEEITTVAVPKLTKEDPLCTDAIKTEKNTVYHTKEAAISTSFNDAYGYLHREHF